MLKLCIIISCLIITIICRKPPVYRIDGSGSEETLSSELMESLYDQKAAGTGRDSLYQIGNPYKSTVKTSDIIQGDINNSIALGLPINNGDIDSDHFQLLYSITNGATIPSKNITLKLNKSRLIIQSKPTPIKEINDSYYKIICNYSMNDIDYHINNCSNSGFKDIKKIEKSNKITFAHIGKTIKVLKYDNITNSIDIKSMIGYLQSTEVNAFNSIVVKTFWLSNQKGSNHYLILYDNTQLYFWLISITDYSFTLKQKETIQIFDFNSKKVVKYDDYLYYTYSDTVNNKISMNRYKIITPPIASEKLFEVDNDIVDFLVEQGLNPNNPPSIYYIEKGRGLHFYENNRDVLRYPHLNMERLDYFINPFFGHKFIGVQIKQIKDNEEFFIEIMLPNSPSSDPKINKVFTSNKKDYLPFYTFDLFHSFFYDKTLKQMYIIRRGLINIVTFLTYQINLNDYSTPHILTSISQFDKEANDTLILFTQEDLAYSIDYLEYPKHKVNCTFKEEGNYTLAMLQFSEACSTSLSAVESTINSCQKVVLFNIEIHDKTNRSLINLIQGWLIAFFILGFIVMSITVLLYSDCFKVNIFSIVKDERFLMKGICYDDALMKKALTIRREDSYNNYNESGSLLRDTSIKSSHMSSKPKKGGVGYDKDISGTISTERRLNSMSKKSMRDNVESDNGNVIQIRKK